MIDPSDRQIEAASAELRAGNLVAMPTETVYGLAANAWDETAVSKIFEAKGRPATNPLIVHIYDWTFLDQCAEVPLATEIDQAMKQLDAFWPGPLTLILPKSQRISSLVTAGRETVAVRVPRHPVARKLLKSCNFPVAAPSANRSTAVSPTTAQHVDDELGEQVAIILDGGPSELGLESTILDLTESPPRILRHGGVTAESLAKALHLSVDVLTRGTDKGAKTAPSGHRAPGQMKVHYSPRTPVRLQSDWIPVADERVGWIRFHVDTSAEGPEASIVRILSNHGDLTEIARSLFATLRELDQLDLDLIVIDTCEEEGMGRAIMDRIRRASARRDV